MSYYNSSTVGACHFENLSLQTETVLHLLTLARLQSNGTYHLTTHNHKFCLQRDVDLLQLWRLVLTSAGFAFSYGFTPMILIEPPLKYCQILFRLIIVNQHGRLSPAIVHSSDLFLHFHNTPLSVRLFSREYFHSAWNQTKPTTPRLHSIDHQASYRSWSAQAQVKRCQRLVKTRSRILTRSRSMAIG